MLTPRCLDIVAGALLLPAYALAAEPDLLRDRFFVSLGGFILETDTKVELDGTTEGSECDLEETFGEDVSTRFRVDAWWRFAQRHKLRALWFNSDANRTRTIDEEVDWG